jgi:hypothetical protein
MQKKALEIAKQARENSQADSMDIDVNTDYDTSETPGEQKYDNNISEGPTGNSTIQSPGVVSNEVVDQTDDTQSSLPTNTVVASNTSDQGQALQNQSHVSTSSSPIVNPYQRRSSAATSGKRNKNHQKKPAFSTQSLHRTYSNRQKITQS